jgi:hypothetical protein
MFSSVLQASDLGYWGPSEVRTRTSIYVLAFKRLDSEDEL